MRAGVDSSDAVVSCLGGDGGRTPPKSLAKVVEILEKEFPMISYSHQY